MQTAMLKPWISPEDYLTLERTADVRHEYVNGEVYAMVGGTLRHNEIAGNLFLALGPRARERGCCGYMSDVKVRVEAANTYYYPDLVISCDPKANDRHVIHAPSLIVEVLSESTEAVDRREKRLHYQTIPSLREFLLVSQDEQRIEVYRCTASGWICEIVTEGELSLDSVDVTVTMDDIYA